MIPDPYFYAVTVPAVLLLLGIAAFRKDFDRDLLRFILPFGVLGIVVGALLFKLLNAHTVAAIVGIFTLLFLAQRVLFPPKPDSPLPPKWLGAMLTDWRVDRRALGAAHQSGHVLSLLVRRHVADRVEAGVGWVGGLGQIVAMLFIAT